MQNANAHSTSKNASAKLASIAMQRNALCINKRTSAQTRSNTMHNNTYTVVGTSVLNNVCKIRFANGLAKRFAVLKRNKHTNINLMECAALHKLQAAQYALTQTQQFNAEELAVIQAYVNANTVA